MHIYDVIFVIFAIFPYPQFLLPDPQFLTNDKNLDIFLETTSCTRRGCKFGCSSIIGLGDTSLQTFAYYGIASN